MQEIRVLHVEDDDGDAFLVAEALAREPGFDLVRVSRLWDGTEALLAGGFDVVLLDLNLPDSPGEQAVDLMVGQAPPHVPVVVCSGLDAIDVLRDAIDAGADDYIAKGDLSSGLLARTLRSSVLRRRRLGVLSRSTL